MTERSTFERKTLREPLKHIGARDLLQVGYSYAGTLRKEGKLEREIRKRFHKSDRPWRQFYVILSGGCVYIYSDDSSKSPKKSFSLRLYNSVEPFSLESQAFRFCFRVLPSEESDLRQQCFSCTDASTRKIWVKHFEDEILCTRDPKSIKQPATKCDPQDDYDEIDTDLIENEKKITPARYTPLPSKDSKRKSLQMIKKEETQKTAEVKRSMSIPHTSAERDKVKPMYHNYEICGDDSNEYVNISRIEDVSIYEGPPNLARNLVSRAEPGTFLIRHSKQSSEQTPYALVVQTAAGPVQIHIYQSDKNVYLSERDVFSSLSQLVKFYQGTVLPSQSNLKLKTQITS